MAQAQWLMLSPRDPRYPVLPIEGRRSAYTEWPAHAACARCGAVREGGYSGPIRGEQQTFPDDRLVLVCQPCAFAEYALAPDALAVHHCNIWCTDRLHVDLVEENPEILSQTTAQKRIMSVADPYATSAWRIIDVSPAPATYHGPSPAMAIWLEVDRPISWPEEHDLTKMLCY